MSVKVINGVRVENTEAELSTILESNKVAEKISTVKAEADGLTASKRAGVKILGVMCSATKEDQDGLTALGLDYSMTTAAGGTFTSTKFSFENGNVLVITADNFATVYNTWVPFRRSFFAVGE